MSRFMTYIRFIKKLKQFHKNRNLENVLREDWSSCRELEEFCRDITSITEAGPEMRFQQKQAEYLALQNQINPHFLYNTLEAIRADALIAGVDQIADTTEALATFFRYTITDVERLVTLSDELENVEDYFTIQKFRFGDRMNLELELNDEELLSARMPRLVLQPLVENAVRYGVDKRGFRIINISAETKEDAAVIAVTDHGSGIPDEVVRSLKAGQGKGVGLLNVHKRLQSLYGEEGGLQITVTENGSRVAFRIPLGKIEDLGEPAAISAQGRAV